MICPFRRIVDLRPCVAILVVALFTVLIRCSPASAESDKAGEASSLFSEDGAPEGWTVRQWDDISKPAGTETSWVVRDGVLHGGEPRGTWVVSEREYDNFELEFEFKLGPTGNSGLALRAPLKGDPAFDGMELQMADFRYNPDAKDSELTGGIYRAIAPQKQVYKPEEWNRYEITLDGSHLLARLNGELIHDIDLSEQNQVVKRHDGSLAPPVKDRPTRGHIGFQNLSRGGDDVLIRNVQIKVLD
jgi:3-keto-disaccharide hydrolase